MQQLDYNRIPAHVAMIMDGNGRWAKAKGLPRTAGHVEGIARVKQITEESARLGIKYLTVYAFSTENWNRPMQEVETLMNLILTNLEEEIFIKNNVRFRVIGDMSRLSETIRKRLQDCIDHTAANTGMTMVVALSYSSRWEITNAARQIADEVKAGKLKAEDIDDECISRHLTTGLIPDPDLLIRTGGELRISNFLLWQCAYTEFYFTDEFWPDFNVESLHRAIIDYQQRQRRFGKTGEQVTNEE
ncbi:MAG: isoprenyl transferase [Bacteroidaceae bacterium]|nr:isoprenyl transferase [Bacteroidaceae bacterium]